MQRNKHTVYYLEHMQPDWLLTQKLRWLYKLCVFLIVVFSVGSLLAFGSGLAISIETQSNYIGVVSGILIGLTSGVAVWIATISTRSTRNSIIIGTMFACTFSVPYMLYFRSELGLFIGFTIGFVVGVTFGILSRWRQYMQMPSQLNIISFVDRLYWSWFQGFRGMLLGFAAGVLFAFLTWRTITKSYDTQSGIAFSVGFGLAVSVICSFFGGLAPKRIEISTLPNQGFRNSTSNALLVGAVITLTVSAFIGLTLGGSWQSLFFTPRDNIVLVSLLIAICVGAGFGIAMAFLYGGFSCLQHSILRLILYFHSKFPLTLVAFLEHAKDQNLLRRVGGGYIFIHRLLMEHFAAMTDEDIARLAGEVEKR